MDGNGMELRAFITQYMQYSRLKVSEITERTTFEFADAFLNDPECRSWYIRQRYRDIGMDAGQFCCVELACWCLEFYENSTGHKRRAIKDEFILYWPEFRAYGLRHSTNKFCIPVNYCPWCGTHLSDYDYNTRYDAE